MRLGFALVMATGLSLGWATASRAQVAVGVNPWGGVGVFAGSPYGTTYYSSGYYGPAAGLGYAAPGPTVYSSGYGGVVAGGYSAPVYPTAVVGGYYPAYGATTYVYPAYVYRRGGLLNRRRVIGW